jgi:MoaA/NifB/PqqE/SkfB family radical SAM enzyme
MTIQRANIDDVEAFLTSMAELQVNRAELKFVHGPQAPVATREQLRSLMDNLRDWDQSGRFPHAGLAWALWQLVQYLEPIAEGLPTATVYQQEQPRCYAPYLTMVISPHGDVFPCCHLFEDNDGYSPTVRLRRSQNRIASTRESSLEEIWTRSMGPFRDRARLMPAIEARGACGRCTRYAPHNLPISRLSRVLSQSDDVEQKTTAVGQLEAILPPEDLEGLFL